MLTDFFSQFFYWFFPLRFRGKKQTKGSVNIWHPDGSNQKWRLMKNDRKKTNLLKTDLQIRHVRFKLLGYFVALMIKGQPAVHETQQLRKQGKSHYRSGDWEIHSSVYRLTVSTNSNFLRSCTSCSRNTYSRLAWQKCRCSISKMASA